MKGNFRNSYMNDSEIENVSGGMSTTKKVIVGVAALAGTIALAYGGGVIYEKKKKDTKADTWGKAFKHPFGLFWGTDKDSGGGEQESKK